MSHTEININIERTLFEDHIDEPTVRVAEKFEDLKALLESGSEHVCRKDNLANLKKGK